MTILDKVSDLFRSMEKGFIVLLGDWYGEYEERPWSNVPVVYHRDIGLRGIVPVEKIRETMRAEIDRVAVLQPNTKRLYIKMREECAIRLALAGLLNPKDFEPNNFPDEDIVYTTILYNRTVQLRIISTPPITNPSPLLYL